jgi:hypothetical protein
VCALVYLEYCFLTSLANVYLFAGPVVVWRRAEGEGKGADEFVGFSDAFGNFSFAFDGFSV